MQRPGRDYITAMHRFANPARFVRLADRLLPWIISVAVICFALGGYFAIFSSPADYQQMETVRIMYIHVPSAWMSMLTYIIVAVASFTGLVWRHPLAFLTAKAAAPIGAALTALTLITGSIWGYPTWGTWWEWADARMTSVLVLLFLYAGYMAMWQMIDDFDKACRATSILALVGVINIPIIKFSVDWWNTLHQGASIVRSGGPTIHSEMQLPLFLMIVAFHAWLIALLLKRVKLELDRRKVAVMQQSLASGLAHQLAPAAEKLESQ